MKKSSLFLGWCWLILAACVSGGPLHLPTGTPSPFSVLPQPTPARTPWPVPSPSAVGTVPASEPTPWPVLPDPEGYTWVPVVQGLTRPVGAYAPPGDARRFFVLEQAGVIRVVQDGVLLPEPFLDLRDRVGSRANEQGLLGLAFHPRYGENGAFFVNYTDRAGNTVVARFRVSADPNRADPITEERLLYIEQPYANHNGGHLAFGPDGYLYIGMGDGGSAGDPQGNAQNPHSLLGKLLRLDVDHGVPYAIPPDNPFVSGGGRGEVWALGLRNPWKFAFDPATGDLYIGDVGQNRWEEVDFLPAGTPGGINFGWNYREGTHPFKGAPPEGLALTDPIWEYGHNQGCSITGGVVVRDPALPAWDGVYLFGDYCSGRVWGLVPRPGGGWEVRLLFETPYRIAAFGQNRTAGSVWLMDHGGGVYLLTRR